MKNSEVKIEIHFEEDTENRWRKIIEFLEKLIDSEIKKVEAENNTKQ